MEEQLFAGHLCQIDGQWGVIVLGALSVLIHDVALTTQPEEGQIAHHHDGTGGFLVTLGGYLAHTLPIDVVDTLLHAEFLVKIKVLVPRG